MSPLVRMCIPRIQVAFGIHVGTCEKCTMHARVLHTMVGRNSVGFELVV